MILYRLYYHPFVDQANDAIIPTCAVSSTKKELIVPHNYPCSVVCSAPNIQEAPSVFYHQVRSPLACLRFSRDMKYLELLSDSYQSVGHTIQVDPSRGRNEFHILHVHVFLRILSLSYCHNSSTVLSSHVYSTIAILAYHVDSESVSLRSIELWKGTPHSDRVKRLSFNPHQSLTFYRPIGCCSTSIRPIRCAT